MRVCVCLLQVHGVVNDTIAFVQKVLNTELNSATDNPVSFTINSKAQEFGMEKEYLPLSVYFCVLHIFSFTYY